MTDRLRQLFFPPIFEDAEKTRIAALLHTVLISGIGLLPLIVIAVVVAQPAGPQGVAFVAGLILVYLIAWLLLQRGHIRSASIFLPLALWLVITIAILVTGGIGGLGLSVYIVVTIMASLLMGANAWAIFFLLSVLTSIVILFLEAEGFLPPPIFTGAPMTDWVVQAIVFIWITALLFILTQSHRDALDRVRTNQAALAEANCQQQIVRASLEARTHDLERRITQLQVAADVARDAATLGKVDELLNRVVTLVRDRFGFYHAGIFMVDDRGEYAVLCAANSEPGRQMLDVGHRLKVGEVGIVGYVTGTGQPRIALDVGKDAVYFRNPYLPETRSELTLPLKTAQKVIGALDVQSKREAAFDHDDVVILQTLADQLAIAIENARLFEATRRQIEELTILHAVATAGAEAGSQDVLIERATQLIGETLFPDNFGVMLLDEATGVLHYHPSYRGLSDEIKKSVSVQIGRGISGRVALQGKPIRVSDVTRDPAYIDVHMGMRSELCVPLKIGARVIGVINAENARHSGFTAADERLLATFAGQLATALEKVRLFEVESRRAVELEALRQASLHLTSNLELQPVLEAILMHAIQLVSAHTGHLFLYDGENLTFGTALWATGYEHTPFAIPRPQGMTYTVARTGQRIVIPDVRQHSIFEGRSWDGAVVGLPLRRGQQVIGVMNISFEGQPHEFDENELRVLELLADQAAIALVNARLYAEAQQRAKELAEALAQRDELVRLKSEFIQNVSHELRTPLAIVRGYIELFDRGDLGTLEANQREVMGIISRRINLLNKLVDDLTAILEAEAHKEQHELVYISDLATKAVEDFQKSAGQAELTLTAEIVPDLPPFTGNAAHIFRVLDNLIGNAIKFTPAGGRVTVHLYREGGENVLEVSDTGVGIPAGQLARIFERFYQVDGSTTRRYGGTGLGLALVKEIVDAHKGQVSVQSQPGEGSRFTVRFPAPETSPASVSEHLQQRHDDLGADAP